MARTIEASTQLNMTGVSEKTAILDAVNIAQNEILNAGELTPGEATLLGAQYGRYRVTLDRSNAQKAIGMFDRDDVDIEVEGEDAIGRARYGELKPLKRYLKADAKRYMGTLDQEFGEKLSALADKMPSKGDPIGPTERAVVFVARKMNQVAQSKS